MSMNADALFRFCRLIFCEKVETKIFEKISAYLKNSRVYDDMIPHITVCLRYTPVDYLAVSVNKVCQQNLNNLSVNQNPNC